MKIQLIPPALAACCCAVALLTSAPAVATDWLAAQSYYSHDPQTGERVNQWSPIGPFYIATDPSYRQGGYRQTRSGLSVGGSSDQYHVVQEWGPPVRPYGEWAFPYRPYSVPYSQWGAPYAGLGGGVYGAGLGGGPYGYGDGGYGRGGYGRGGYGRGGYGRRDYDGGAFPGAATPVPWGDGYANHPPQDEDNRRYGPALKHDQMNDRQFFWPRRPERFVPGDPGHGPRHGGGPGPGPGGPGPGGPGPGGPGPGGPGPGGP